MLSYLAFLVGCLGLLQVLPLQEAAVSPNLALFSYLDSYTLKHELLSFLSCALAVKIEISGFYCLSFAPT